MVRALLAGTALLLSAPATASPSNDGEVPEQQAFQTLMDAAMAELMKPGPRNDSWNKGGVDLHSLVAAAPGGQSRNYILSVDKDGDRTVTVSGAGDSAPLAPAGWQAGTRTGSDVGGGDAVDLTFGRLDGQSYFAGTQARERVGNAYCSVGGMLGVMYTDGESPANSELPQGMIDTMFAMMVRRFEKQRICWRYDRDGDGYRVSHFLDDGQSLPALDAAGYRVTIVAAAPIDRLLASPSNGK